MTRKIESRMTSAEMKFFRIIVNKRRMYRERNKILEKGWGWIP